uniref:Uncharacterized protein AlNc14C218G9060 n=1 Tax=Albugo laibachii Nc14 TaxID=890382 RepID=F0WRR4_9STRA|nr:conserved hypothetical protein [Albugo laibachii Nc14]|eukprot:CCA24029.1 conserved hypothetical protein [Albugo laibachii Nc14]
MKTRVALLSVLTSQSKKLAAFNGDGTAYSLSTPLSGNCNFMTWPPAATTKYAAINNAQWNNGLECGRCAQVTCVDSACKSKTTEIVYILDRCTECAFGDIDLSPNVFQTISGSSPSRLKVQWSFVDCPLRDTSLKLCLKPGSNPYWIAIQPSQTLSGVKSLSINGVKAQQMGSAYYFKVESSNGLDLSKLQVSMTSSIDQTLNRVVALSPGACVDTNSQFQGAAQTSSAPIKSSQTPSASLMSIASGTREPLSTPPFSLMRIESENQANSPDTHALGNALIAGNTRLRANETRIPNSTPHFSLMKIGRENQTASTESGRVSNSSKTVQFAAEGKSSSSLKSLISSPVVVALAGCVLAVGILAITAFAVRKGSRKVQTPKLTQSHRGGVALEATATDLSSRGNYKSEIAIL